MVELSPFHDKVLCHLKEDLPDYAEYCIKTKTKDGSGIVPVVFNRVQHYIHQQCEDQKKRKGWVRKIIVKGRQQGSSTYSVCRFFHATQFFPGTNVFILSHEAKSTAALFDKVDTFNSELQKVFPSLAHGIVTENRQEMEFSNKSWFGVGTAGSIDTGRGLTISRFLGSECGFWENSQAVRTGAMQTVALMRGTEVILESTCNGLNWWYTFCMEAVDGKNDYELMFIPWYWTDEYRSDVPDDFYRTPDEIELCEQIARYTDGTAWILDDGQLVWRRSKISELASIASFRQEYPCNLKEAFQSSGEPYYESDLVLSALDNVDMPDDQVGALILGVDPARVGDRTVLTYRCGRVIEKIRIFKEKMDTQRTSGLISDAIDKEGVERVFIDVGMGYGIIDHLKERGYSQYVEGVDFGQSPIDDKYANKRAEMAVLFNKWLLERPNSIRSADIDQRRAIISDIGMMPQPKPTSNSRILFPTKEEIKKVHKRSPDILDSIMLTFAFPVKSSKDSVQSNKPTSQPALTARRRVKDMNLAPSNIDPFALRWKVDPPVKKSRFRN